MRISDWSSDVCSSDLVDLRHAFLESAQRQIALLERARCDANWQIAAWRLKRLAASFGVVGLMSLSEEAGEGAPGEPVMLRKLKSAIDAFEMSCSGKIRLPKGLQSAGWVGKRTATATLLLGCPTLPFAAVLFTITP